MEPIIQELVRLITVDRSSFTEHTIQNNKDLTPDFGGQSETAGYC